jgi:hypothetical protein
MIVEAEGVCEGDKKEPHRQRHGKAQENARHKGGHAEKDYIG